MPIGASIGGSLISGGLGAWGASKAAGIQKDYYNRALEMQRPYAQMGQGAMTTLANLYGFGPSGGQAFNDASLAAFRNAPGYQFARGEGLRSVDFGDSARGQLLSSNNLRGRMDYATGKADQTFMGSYVQPLLHLAGIGSNAANASASTLGQMGGAAASGVVGPINAINGAIGNAGNNLMLYNYLNKSAYGNPTYTPQQFDQMWSQAAPSKFGSGIGSGGAP